MKQAVQFPGCPISSSGSSLCKNFNCLGFVSDGGGVIPACHAAAVLKVYLVVLPLCERFFPPWGVVAACIRNDIPVWAEIY